MADERSILQQGYFLIESCKGINVKYDNIEYFKTENEVVTHIREEYAGTDYCTATKFSISELLEGRSFSVETGRQGTSTVNCSLLLVHDSNLHRLFIVLNQVKGRNDETGDVVYLSEYLQKAKTEREIARIINIYNDHQENCW